MADSTNVDRRGRSANETQIRAGLGPILAAARQTVVLATFSSNLYRVQSVLDLAEELGRKVAICGYSLERNCGIALQLGILHHHGDLVRPLQDVVKLPPRQRLIITTGTQGEPSSALTRMALNSFRGWRVEPGDTIILSSRIIPGNERGIYRMINHFYRHGARVVTERDGLVHGSGHAYQDEMRELFEIVRPRHFIPVHGELRQLIHNQDFAQTCGLSDDQVTVMLNGEQVTLHDGSVNLEETSWAGQVLVDGKMLDGVEEVVLRDRRHLAEDGMVTVVLAIDKDSRRIVSGPDIITRGFVHVDENEPLLQACRDLVLRTYEQCEQETQEEWEVVKVEIRKALRKFLREQTDRYPVILPVVMEL
jgi:ribonuclease J